LILMVDGISKRVGSKDYINVAFYYNSGNRKDEFNPLIIKLGTCCSCLMTRYDVIRQTIRIWREFKFSNGYGIVLKYKIRIYLASISKDDSITSQFRFCFLFNNICFLSRYSQFWLTFRLPDRSDVVTTLQ
jgi:hypothetical protein